MAIENKEVDLTCVPFGSEFYHEGRKYVKMSFANTRILCYDVTDLQQVQIPDTSKVKVSPFLYQDIKKWKGE